MRIGIDVGGTHTDAVLMDGDRLIAATKQLTTQDVTSGITSALDEVLSQAALEAHKVQAVMIGTTQFTNAITERRHLTRVGAIRIGLPSGRGLPPMVDWPQDIRESLDCTPYLLTGGYLYDGWPLAELSDAEIEPVIASLVSKGLKSIAISSVFSPMNPEPEMRLARAIKKAIPDAKLTLSHNIGRLGLMERENAAILNAALCPLADDIVDAFIRATQQRGLNVPIYINQNDGTLMSTDFVRAYPALTFASGPTNSLRGASRLTGLSDAIVVDIGGTTSDIGVLKSGFPRESQNVIEIGGVRTNFRMPDILALGLGGGSLVSEDGKHIGPKSVGHNLVRQGRAFGGDTLTATDIIIAMGKAKIGDKSKVRDIPPYVIANARAEIHTLLDRHIDMMKPGGKTMPVILVGGGHILVTDELAAASKIYRPEHAGVANAIGATIAQIGAEAERLVSFRETPREEALETLIREAARRAEAAGAEPSTIRIVDMDETAIPYMDGMSVHIRIKVIGDRRL